MALVLERKFVRQIREGPPVPPPPPPATPAGPVRDVQYTNVHRLYFARDTFLPLAWLAEFFADGVKGGDYLATYDNKFVRSDELPEGIFEPGSLGYEPEDTEGRLEDLERIVRVFWLGDEMPFGPDGRLTLTSVVPGFGQGSSGELQYQTPSGSHRIGVILWQREPWEEHFKAAASGGLLSGERPVDRYELEIDSKRLVVYTIDVAVPAIVAPVPSGGSPPPTANASVAPGPKETFVYIDLDEVVVQLTTNRSGGPDTVEELRLVAENLRRR